MTENERSEIMKYCYSHRFVHRVGDTLIRIRRDVPNPLPGLTFVSVAYWQRKTGEIVGVIF